jgi:hypothetical protein
MGTHSPLWEFYNSVGLQKMGGLKSPSHGLLCGHIFRDSCPKGHVNKLSEYYPVRGYRFVEESIKRQRRRCLTQVAYLRHAVIVLYLSTNL